MKVLLINGSAKANGCTFTALTEVEQVLKSQGIETELIQLGAKPIGDCIGCGQCSGKMRCQVYEDGINAILEKAAVADGFVFGTPVYYAHPSGRILSAMDRIFYAGSALFAQKPGAVVCSARRGGTTAALDALVKHLTINQMPVISSTYWNMVHGNTPAEVMQDKEGLQTMHNLGTNMAWILKCIEAGKEKGINPPANRKQESTNFIR